MAKMGRWIEVKGEVKEIIEMAELAVHSIARDGLIGFGQLERTLVNQGVALDEQTQYEPVVWKDKDAADKFVGYLGGVKDAMTKERLLLLWTLTFGIDSPLEDIHALVDRANESQPPCRGAIKEAVRVLHGLDIEKNERQRSLPDYEMHRAAKKKEAQAKASELSKKIYADAKVNDAPTRARARSHS